MFIGFVKIDDLAVFSGKVYNFKEYTIYQYHTENSFSNKLILNIYKSNVYYKGIEVLIVKENDNCIKSCKKFLNEHFKSEIRKNKINNLLKKGKN